MQPEIRYTRSLDGVAVAYQVVGEGTRDLVLAPGWIFHVELVWEQPSFESFMRRLTSLKGLAEPWELFTATV